MPTIYRQAMRAILLFAVALVFSSYGNCALAEGADVSSSPTLTCAVKTNAELVACAKAAKATEDAALNAAYKRPLPRLSTYQKEQLKRSERAWLQFRDAQCGFEGSVVVGGPLGIIAFAQTEAEANCYLRETHARTDALKAGLDVEWDGVVRRPTR